MPPAGERELADLTLRARGLAHDLNNLITAMLGHAALIEAESEPGSAEHESAGVIVQSAERARHLAARLLHLGRDPQPAGGKADVNVLAREVAALIGPSLGPGTRLTAQLHAAPATVAGDAGQVHQLLLNLVLNARDAVAGGGEVAISTAGLEGGRLDLRVSDTGPGIAPELRQRVFEPFFTTKSERRGTGIGLDIARRVVEDLGGTIEVVDAPGCRGACFRVVLPLAG